MQVVAVDHLVGQTLGSCHVEQLLGRGRLSAVYLARQSPMQRPVALTTFLLPASFSAQARERFLARFRHEAAALVSLEHPHILPIYEYGEQYGYPYLATPYVTEGSLAGTLKQQGRYTPAAMLDVLQPICSALAYAHSRGVIHGTLKPANVLLREGERLQVAGFGLVRILEVRGIEQTDSPYAHLLNVAGTFLGSPEYVAPECVEGQLPDARSDIYALGVLLFELLSGRPPFTGSNPIETAMQHIHLPLPSLRALCPTISPDLESVVYRALARDPAQRFQRVQELAAAFAHSATGAPEDVRVSSGRIHAVNARPLASRSSGKWQFIPPVVTGHHAAVNQVNPVKPVNAVPAPLLHDAVTLAAPPVQPAPSMPLPASALFQHAPAAPAAPVMPVAPLVLPSPAVPAPSPLLSSEDVDTMAIDPFEWWSKTFTGHLPAQGSQELQGARRTDALAGTLAQAGTYGPSRRNARKQGMSRRQVVAAIAGGGVALGVLGFGGLSLAHMLKPSSHSAAVNTATGTASTQHNAPATGKTPTRNHTQPQAKPTPKPTSKPQPTPTHANPTPTPKPTQPTPTPSRTGTVIGMTNNPGVNSSKSFTNPADGHGSLLIHLPNGNFAAYESACTHQGVTVYYDGNSHQIVCPAHSARFDPANGAKVLQGPAPTPLASVTIHVNADGTITV